MEARHIIAYLLIVAIVGFLTFAFRYATREWRAHQRARRASRKRRQERLAGD